MLRSLRLWVERWGKQTEEENQAGIKDEGGGGRGMGGAAVGKGTLHSLALGDLIMRRYGLGPRHTSHTMGKSVPLSSPSGAAAAFTMPAQRIWSPDRP